VPLTCVIVDDSPDFLRAASKLLQREGMPVLGTAHTGQQAVEVTAATQPGVVLVDVSLRDESGFDVARRLNELDERGDLAIILISTRSGSEFAELIEKSPALGFIPKSKISVSAVRSMVEAVTD